MMIARQNSAATLTNMLDVEDGPLVSWMYNELGKAMEAGKEGKTASLLALGPAALGPATQVAVGPELHLRRASFMPWRYSAHTSSTLCSSWGQCSSRLS